MRRQKLEPRDEHPSWVWYPRNPVFAPIKELDSKYPFELRKVAGLFGGGE